METYGSFAAIYDTLMDDFDYEKWAEQYWALLNSGEREVRSLCDCACGTGSLTIPMAQRCAKVIGVDLSGEMLEVAAEKARKAGVPVRFVCQDMRALELPRAVDAVMCGCDGVNYLTTLGDVKTFFLRVHASLKKGGVFAFDISSDYKLEKILGNAFFGEDRDEVTYLWTNRWDAQARTVTMELAFFCKTEDGLYRRFDETHVQRAHTRAELTVLLTECGYADIEVQGDEVADKRLHFRAIKY